MHLLPANGTKKSCKGNANSRLGIRNKSIRKLPSPCADTQGLIESRLSFMVPITAQKEIQRENGDRFNCCQVIYSQFGLAIHQDDHQARRRFIKWAQNEIAVVPDFHKRILFSDEAHFWLNGYVNKQNGRIWSEANPQVYVETPLHQEKLTVWCALWAGGILLPKRCRPQGYGQWNRFFELLPDNTTINSEVYCHELDKLNDALQQKRSELINMKGVVFNQDNARPHTNLVIRQKPLQLEWDTMPHPPYSPDMAPSDYYLFWSLLNFLDGKTFTSNEEVKNHLDQIFASKDQRFYERGIMLLPERWQKVLDQNG
ncbi:mariner Mos1 transposase [Trichonephila clavipes]|nr:mariner Mos1 transposase [Trichonephila clavipes]